MSLVKVSIYIPAFNAEKTIKKTIDTTLNLCKSGTRAIPRYQKLMNGRVNSINRIFANLKIK